MNFESANAPGFPAWKLVLKLFLPSWNFFNDFDAVPRLEFRLLRRDGGESDWRPLYPVNSTASWRRVIFNPWGNVELLEKSLIDRVATALREGAASAQPGLAHGDDCALLTRIVRMRIHPLGPDHAAASFRFRLVLIDSTASETLYESPPQPLESGQ